MDRGLNKTLFLLLFAVSILAFLTTYFRIETTIIGYQVGHLREKEIELLQKKRIFASQIAKLSTRQELKKRFDLD